MRTKMTVLVLMAIVGITVLVLLIAKNNQTASAKAEFLKEQTRLAEIVRSDGDIEMRMNTVGKIKDQTLLAEFVSNEKEHSWVRFTALDKLKDQLLLAKIAKGDGDMASWAASSLTDKALLQDIVKNSSNLLARACAAEKLNDTALAEELNKQIRALRRKKEEIRHIIMDIEHAKNQEFLLNLIEASKKENGWEEVRQAAEAKLKELMK